MVGSDNKGRSGFAAALRERKAKEKPDNARYNKEIAGLRSRFSALGKPESLKELLLRASSVYGDRTQVVEFSSGGHIDHSAKDLCEDASALAFALTKKGLAGKNIGVIGRNGYAWMVSFFAACCGVGTAVPLDKELRGEKLKYLIEKADVELVLCDDTLLAGVREFAKGEYDATVMESTINGDIKDFADKITAESHL